VKPDLSHFRRLHAPAYVRPLGPLAYRIPRRVAEEVYGLRTYADDRYRPGRRLELEVLLPEGGSATVVVEVAWVKRLPEGSPANYEVGLHYVEVTPEDLARIERVAQPG
jgi:hypothetical protein